MACFRCEVNGAPVCDGPCGFCRDLCPGIEATICGDVSPVPPSDSREQNGVDHD